MALDSIKFKIKCLLLADLRRILIALDKPNSGRVAALRSRVLQLLDSPHTRAAVMRAVHDLDKNSDNTEATAMVESTSSSVTPANNSTLSRRISSDRNSSSSPDPVELFQSSTPKFPLHPDVRFKLLPFFDEVGELIKPTSVYSPLTPRGRAMEKHLEFHLTPAQAQLIRSGRQPGPEYTIQVLLRIGLLETTSEQNDSYPPGLVLYVNNTLFPLPAAPQNAQQTETQRLQQPFNITPYLKVDPTFANKAVVISQPHFQRYVAAVYLVKKQTSQNLLNRLKEKKARVACYTKAMIIQKLKDDSNEIAPTYLRTKLVCPLGKMRLKTPGRATTCDHVQCFDCATFLAMNEKKPTWNCPVCNRPALYEHLAIDEYFQEVLSSDLLPKMCTEIQLNADGSWTAVGTTGKEVFSFKKEQSDVEIVADSDEDCGSTVTVLAPSPKPMPQEVDLTVSDDESPRLPLKKRRTDYPAKPTATAALPASSQPVRNRADSPTPSRVGNPSCPAVIQISDSGQSSSDGSSDSDGAVMAAIARASAKRRPNPAALPPPRRRRPCIYTSESSSDTTRQPDQPQLDEATNQKDMRPTTSWNLGSFLTSHQVTYKINQAKSSTTTLVISKAGKSTSKTSGEDNKQESQSGNKADSTSVSVNSLQEINYIVKSVIEEIIDKVVYSDPKAENVTSSQMDEIFPSFPMVELESSPEQYEPKSELLSGFIDITDGADLPDSSTNGEWTRKRMEKLSEDDSNAGWEKSTESQACCALLDLSFQTASKVQKSVFSSQEGPTSSEIAVDHGSYGKVHERQPFRPSILKRPSRACVRKGIDFEVGDVVPSTSRQHQTNINATEAMIAPTRPAVDDNASSENTISHGEVLNQDKNKFVISGISSLPKNLQRERKSTKELLLSDSEESTSTDDTTTEGSQDSDTGDEADDTGTDTDSSDSTRSSSTSGSQHQNNKQRPASPTPSKSPPPPPPPPNGRPTANHSSSDASNSDNMQHISRASETLRVNKLTDLISLGEKPEDSSLCRSSLFVPAILKRKSNKPIKRPSPGLADLQQDKSIEEGMRPKKMAFPIIVKKINMTSEKGKYRVLPLSESKSSINSDPLKMSDSASQQSNSLISTNGLATSCPPLVKKPDMADQQHKQMDVEDVQLFSESLKATDDCSRTNKAFSAQSVSSRWYNPSKCGQLIRVFCNRERSTVRKRGKPSKVSVEIANQVEESGIEYHSDNNETSTPHNVNATLDKCVETSERLVGVEAHLNSTVPASPTSAAPTLYNNHQRKQTSPTKRRDIFDLSREDCNVEGIQRDSSSASAPFVPAILSRKSKTHKNCSVKELLLLKDPLALKKLRKERLNPVIELPEEGAIEVQKMGRELPASERRQRRPAARAGDPIQLPLQYQPDGKTIKTFIMDSYYQKTRKVQDPDWAKIDTNKTEVCDRSNELCESEGEEEEQRVLRPRVTRSYQERSPSPIEWSLGNYQEPTVTSSITNCNNYHNGVA